MDKIIICERCDKEFTHSKKGSPKYCSPCSYIRYTENAKSAVYRYIKTEKGKAARKRYYDKRKEADGWREYWREARRRRMEASAK